MEYSLNENKLTFNLAGRIDSNTSQKIEEEISATIEGKTFDELILDFENIDFVSSAGLRVILRFKKKYSSLRIINVVPEVYEVFEMTGFSEMMNIKKGFRRLTIGEGVEEIGRGANGIVYRYADDMIVKVYFNNAPLEDIKKEIALSKKAFISGVSTAIPFDIVKVGPYYGSVFEMIKAESLSKLINKNPSKIDEYIDMIVELLKTMNGNVIDDENVPTIKDKAILWLDKVVNEVSSEEMTKLRQLFDSIKDDNNMVHRDYHIKNLLMQQGELILIDMDTLSRGSVLFELVGIYNAYKGFPVIRDKSESSFLGISDEVSYYIWERIFNLYFEGKSKEELEAIEEKIALVSTVQLLKIHLKASPVVSVGLDKKFAKLREKLHYLISKVDSLAI